MYETISVNVFRLNSMPLSRWVAIGQDFIDQIETKILEKGK